MSKPILLIGEAPGEAEARLGVGFVGPSGVELLRMLDASGVIAFTPSDREYLARYYRTGDSKHVNLIWELHREEVIRTNVFSEHPPSNKLEYFCGPKASAIPGYPALLPSKHVQARFSSQLDRLGDEILAADPDLIVCLGNTPLWALAGRTGISKLRGTTITSSQCVSGYKLLLCYHPSAVLRQYDLRATTIADLSKAVRERESATITRPTCSIWIEPSLHDIETFIHEHIRQSSLVACDIETTGTRITHIGFSPRRDLALVVSFDDPRKAGRSYWPTASDERQCWELVRSILEDNSIAKVFQNGMYDISFLIRSYGIRTFNAIHDTMLLQHALLPEALKGLGYLGSLYTSHGAWKTERKGTETIKKDQ